MAAGFHPRAPTPLLTTHTPRRSLDLSFPEGSLPLASRSAGVRLFFPTSLVLAWALMRLRGVHATERCLLSGRHCSDEIAHRRAAVVVYFAPLEDPPFDLELFVPSEVDTRVLPSLEVREQNGPTISHVSLLYGTWW